MKKYIKIILIVISGFVVSCSESFLELTPQQSVSDSKAMTNLQDLNSSITGVYNQISSTSYYGRNFILIPDVMADDVKQNSQSNRIEDYAEHIVNVSDTDASNMWTTMYAAINAANAIIDSDINVPEKVFRDKDHIIGEAYALRGLIYFDLVRLFAQHYTYTSDAGQIGRAHV